MHFKPKIIIVYLPHINFKKALEPGFFLWKKQGFYRVNLPFRKTSFQQSVEIILTHCNSMN